MKSGWERAVEWYKESEIVASVSHDLIGRRRIPADVRSREFENARLTKLALHGHNYHIERIHPNLSREATE